MILMRASTERSSKPQVGLPKPPNLGRFWLVAISMVVFFFWPTEKPLIPQPVVGPQKPPSPRRGRKVHG